ncbi:MAG: DUF4331 family protein [Gemmatimonadaceae bacterium]
MKPAAMLALVIVAAGCRETVTEFVTDTLTVTQIVRDTVVIGDTAHVFAQVERLANPLAMEVFVEKRFHTEHDAYSPVRDPEEFTPDYVQFVTTVAGRSEDYARAIAGALLGTAQNPGDKLTVFTNRAAGVTAAIANDPANSMSSSTGWLTYVLAPGVGYGGRKLRGDDTVDKGASVVFGTALGNTTNVSPGLVTDNVDNTNPAPLTTFPYFPGANPAP